MVISPTTPASVDPTIVDTARREQITEAILETVGVSRLDALALTGVFAAIAEKWLVEARPAESTVVPTEDLRDLIALAGGFTQRRGRWIDRMVRRRVQMLLPEYANLTD